MCGRYTQGRSWEELLALFRLIEEGQPEGFAPRFNIAPTSIVPVVRREPASGLRRLVLMRWGLVPQWAKDDAMGARLINARAETLAEKPAFRTPFARRRCLVAADGFYEWQARRTGPKQPYWIGLPQEDPATFAGLWDSWRRPDGAALETCTIITTAAVDRLQPIHDRMPLILPEAAFETWLDPAAPADAVRSLLAPFDGPLTIVPVGRRVNDARNDDVGLLRSIAEL